MELLEKFVQEWFQSDAFRRVCTSPEKLQPLRQISPDSEKLQVLWLRLINNGTAVRIILTWWYSFLEPRLSFSGFCSKNATVETGEPSIPFSEEVDDFVRFDVIQVEKWKQHLMTYLFREDTNNTREVRLDCKTFFCKRERRGQYLNERSSASVETAREWEARALHTRG